MLQKQKMEALLHFNLCFPHYHICLLFTWTLSFHNISLFLMSNQYRWLQISLPKTDVCQDICLDESQITGLLLFSQFDQKETLPSAYQLKSLQVFPLPTKKYEFVNLVFKGYHIMTQGTSLFLLPLS